MAEGINDCLNTPGRFFLASETFRRLPDGNVGKVEGRGEHLC